jgi:uncharacterized phage protein (TIGR02218 family)
MKPISASLAAHMAGEVTTLATCWKLTRRDGQAFGFTDHDKNLIIEGFTYNAATGFTPSAISSTSSLAVDNLEVEALLDSSLIEESEIMAGLYDFAEVEVFMANYADVSMGKMRLRTGWFGEIEVKGGRFVAEVRGLTQKLQQNIGEIYSLTCRARLGDARCTKNLAAFTFTGSITAVTSRQIFTDSALTQASGYFDQGKITFTSGLNNGISMEIKNFSNDIITTVLPLPFDVAVGNTYSIVAGCDKTLQTCITKFSNALNFRGEPHVPGFDKLMETAGTRSEW